MIDSLSSGANRAQSARATVRVSIAPLLGGAAASATQVSQLLRGHHGDVIDADGKWLRLRGADGYEGWCHRGYLEVEHAIALPSLASAWGAERRISIGCTVRSTLLGTLDLPLGALLDADEEVTRGIAMNNRARLRYFETDSQSLVLRARELFRGTPYQWGGVTPWGADCSGFVQTVFALHGTQLPRDAWMQGERGREVSSELSDFEPADLLFFSDSDDGRPTHVAISLGETRCVHISLANGGFGVNALDADDPVARHLRESFRFARRIL
ncbi:MAG: SH3 domain-containing C40 family peptidase [Gemmatimonadaceae bacterium]